MAKKPQVVETGRATGLRYGRGRYDSRFDAPHRGGGHRPPRDLPKGVVAGACLVLVLIAFFVVWYAAFRSIAVTVNGEPVQMRAGTTLSELLEGHDYFGVAPGRLLSVNGNVIDDKGGARCHVVCNDSEIPSDQFSSTEMSDGDVLSVENGADDTEDSVEQVVDVPPSVQMEPGGAIQYVSQWGEGGKQKVRVGKVSGESVAGEMVSEKKDLIISSVNPSPSDGKYCALTFDDGPSDYTPQILQILKDKGVKATFFCLGNEASKYPDKVKDLVDAGMEVASHTNAHQNLPNLDRDSLRAEITNAADTIGSAGGTDAPTMMRAPYGAFTSVEWGRAADLITCNVLWNIDTRDWKRPGADAIVSNVLGNIYNGSIILMHDGGGDRSQDVEALPKIIDQLQQQGYKFVTVGKLMKLDGRIPKNVVNGAVDMPEDAELPE